MLNTDRIQTTHVGSLPRTPELLAANEAYQAGTISWEELVATMQQGVRDIVARQSEIGIDIVNDGEYGHTMSSSVDYGAWWNYSFSRLGGLSPSDEDRWDPNAGAKRSSPGNIVLTSFADRRDRQRFAEAYADQSSGILTARKRVAQPKITGPLTYTGHDAVQADIANLKSALEGSGAEQGFIAALDQSGGSTPKALKGYGIEEGAWSSDEEMFALIHGMRSRIVTSPCFNGDKVIGAILFAAVSIAAALTTIPELMIVWRAVLGLAAAMMVPATIGLIFVLFADAKQRGVAIGVWAGGISAGVALGPLLSGLLLEAFGWQATFLVAVPIMALVAIAAPILVPEHRDPSARIDLFSALLLVAGLLAIIYGIKRFAAQEPAGPSIGVFASAR